MKNISIAVYLFNKCSYNVEVLTKAEESGLAILSEPSLQLKYKI